MSKCLFCEAPSTDTYTAKVGQATVFMCQSCNLKLSRHYQKQILGQMVKMRLVGDVGFRSVFCQLFGHGAEMRRLSDLVQMPKAQFMEAMAQISFSDEAE